MPIVTMIKTNETPEGASRTIPMGGRNYTFVAGKEEKNIPVAVAARCLKVNEREKKLLFDVREMPPIVGVTSDHNVPGKESSQAKAAGEKKEKPATTTRRIKQGRL